MFNRLYGTMKSVKIKVEIRKGVAEMKRIFLLVIVSLCLYACMNQSDPITKPASSMIQEDISFHSMVSEAADDEGCEYAQKQKELLAYIRQHNDHQIVKLSDTMSDEELIQALEQLSYHKVILPVYSKNKKHEVGIKVYYAKAANSQTVQQIMYVSLDSVLNKPKKQFQGEVFIHLEACDRIHYIVNGTFYVSGEATVNQLLDTNNCDSLSAIYELSNPYHFYDSIYADGNIQLEQ